MNLFEWKRIHVGTCKGAGGEGRRWCPGLESRNGQKEKTQKRGRGRKGRKRLTIRKWWTGSGSGLHSWPACPAGRLCSSLPKLGPPAGHGEAVFAGANDDEDDDDRSKWCPSFYRSWQEKKTTIFHNQSACAIVITLVFPAAPSTALRVDARTPPKLYKRTHTHTHRADPPVWQPTCSNVLRAVHFLHHLGLSGCWRCVRPEDDRISPAPASLCLLKQDIC